MIDSAMLARIVHEEARAIVAYDQSEPELTVDQKLERRLQRWPIPAVEELAPVVEEVFWSSFLAEESRPCRVRLLYAPTANADAVHWFTTPVNLDREAFRKMSPAHGPTGFLTWRRDVRAAVISGVHAGDAGEPNALTIVASGAGALHVGWAPFRLVTFHAGKIHRMATNFSPRMNVALGVAATLFRSFEPHLAEPILRALIEQGHGGALWIARQGASLEGINVGHDMLPEAGSLVERFEDAAARARWLTSIARLAAVDGAVVLDGRLRVLGFAAFVQMGEDVSVDRRLANGTIEHIPASKLGGGRHRSAVEFCRRNAPALALVVSEDGRVTLIVADAQRHIASTELARVESSARA